MNFIILIWGIDIMGEVEIIEEKKKVCLGCKKQLLDEKLPFCLRCRLAGRNTVANAGEIVVGLAVVAGGAKAIADNKNSPKV